MEFMDIFNNFVSVIWNLEFFFQYVFAISLLSVNLKRKKLFPVRLIALLLIVGTASYFWKWEWGFVLSALRYFGLHMLFTVSVYLLFDVKITQAIFVSTGAYIVQHFGYQVSQLFWNIFFRVADSDIFKIYGYIEIPFNVVIFALSYLFCYFTFIEKINNMEFIIQKKSLLIFTVSIVIATIILNLAQQFYQMSWVLAAVYPAIFCLVAAHLLGEVLKNNKLETDKLVIEKMLDMQKKYAEMNNSSTELINIRCHDLKHQIELLNATPSNEEEKDELVKEIQDEIDLYDSLITTHIPALDVVLTQKAIFCLKKKIKFSTMVSVDNLGEMSKKDIYSLFGNSIDNAIECVDKLKDDSKKIISLVIYKELDKLIISLDNYYENEIEFKDNLPATTKSNKRLHGYGLKSIEYIAQKYNGDVSISTQNNIFALTVSIPLVIEHTKQLEHPQLNS